MAPADSIAQMMKNSTPEMQKAGMDAWMNWMNSHKASFTDMGAPTGKNIRVTKGASSAERNEVCGYSLVQAGSLEEAAKIFEDSAHFTNLPGAYIDVLECMDMPGM